MNSICARWGDRYLVATHRFIPTDALNGPALARTRGGNVVNAPLVAMFRLHDCQAIAAMAHRLDPQVIAECVGTAEQLADPDAMGCDAAQGCLFHRPLPAGSSGALLARQGGGQAVPVPA